MWEALDAKGETLLVGGFVRDAVIGTTTEDTDYDFASILTPDEVTSIMVPLGYSVIPTGIEYGTVTILVDGGHKVEVTTYRGESYRTGSRHPDVFFSKTFLDDSGRRDFTISAMGMMLDGTVVDHHGGVEDASVGLVRAVGDPVARFTEDPLRILRAARFAAKFDFAIELGTLTAMRSTAGGLSTLSRERVAEELRKLLVLPRVADGLRYYKATGVLHELFPELDRLTEASHKDNPYHLGDAWEHTLSAVGHAKADYVTRLATLYHDVGKPDTESYVEGEGSHYYGHEGRGAEIWAEVAARDKLSNELTERIEKVIASHLRPARHSKEGTTRGLRRLYREIGEDWKLLADVSEADVLAHANPSLSSVELFRKEMSEVARTALPPRASVLPTGSGTAVMARMSVRGERLGVALKLVEEAVIDGRFTPTTPESVAEYVWDNRLDCCDR